MLKQLGRLAFRFCVAYSILATIFATLLLSAGIEPPRCLLLLRVDPGKLRQLTEPPGGALDWIVFIRAVGMIGANIVLSFAASIPVLLVEAARLTGCAAIVAGAAVLGAILQVSAYYYAYCVLIRRTE